MGSPLLLIFNVVAYHVIVSTAIHMFMRQLKYKICVTW